MTWSRFDDGYDEHEKVDEAWERDRAAVGLHVMATTACNRWLSDGVIRPRWLLHKLPNRRERERTLRALIDVELFDVLAAGQTAVLVDSDGNGIPVGPFPEDRYIVHDFLERHDSSLQVKERRRLDAERKARERAAKNGRTVGPVKRPAGHPADEPTALEPPVPPKGNRRRDRERYDLQLQAWVDERMPGADARRVHALADWLRPRVSPLTAEAMLDYAKNNPAWDPHQTDEAAA